MKKTSLALAGLALFCAGPAFADNTDTATVTVNGTIVAPLTISNGTFVFPNLVKATATLTKGGASVSGGSTSVKVTCGASDAANSVDYGAGSNPFAAGNSAAVTGVVGGAFSGANQGLVALAARTGTCATLTVGGQSTYHYIATQPAIASNAGYTISDVNCKSDAGTAVVFGTTSLVIGTDNALQCGAKVAADTTVTAGPAQAAGSFTVTVTYD